MASDLFTALDALFHKGNVEKPPSLFVVNRFLAWQPDFAPFAAAISRLRDDAMAWAVWKTALPRAARGPRLGYPAPKRPAAAEGLIAALMERTHLSRSEAETTVDLAILAGETESMARTYGADLGA